MPEEYRCQVCACILGEKDYRGDNRKGEPIFVCPHCKKHNVFKEDDDSEIQG